jgi:predicted lipoprotein with Yx(FWY)xxD motif
MAVRTGREGTWRAALVAGGTVAAVALGVGALSAGTLAVSSPASAAGSSGKPLTITTQRVAKVGTVLATKSGLTLYRYSVDPAGTVTCTGACAKVWPPLLLPKGSTHVKAPHGVKGLSVIHVAGGRLQVFFHHQALYTFISDKKRGQASGQGVENDWFAVLSSGKSSAPVAPPTTTTSTPTTTPVTQPTPLPPPRRAPVTATTQPPATTTTVPSGGGVAF